ncbi:MULTISPECIES: transposase [Mesorhizobium]|uniref:transposase n=1 Tax=Mesorhizobium sp. TaxID=1871066 RepID=UPI00338DA569
MDVQLHVPGGGYGGRLEVIECPTGRRRRTDAEKARIVADSLMPGIRVAEVARKCGVTRWQVMTGASGLRHGSVTLPESMAAAPPLRRCWSKSRLSRGRPAQH